MPSMPPRPSWSLVLLAAALPALAPPALAAPRCAAPSPPVWANVSLPQPVIDNSRWRAQIQQRAPRSHGGNTVGLYVGTLKSALRIGFSTATQGGEACVAVSVVTINLGVDDRRIYLAREWAPGSCPYHAILDHERRHQAADDKAVSAAVRAMRAAIGKTVASIGPLEVPQSQAAVARERLSDAVNAAFRSKQVHLLVDQQRLQRAVDAGFEYARLTASCPEFVNRYDPYTPLAPKGADTPLLPQLR